MITYETTTDGLTADQLAGPFFEGWANAPDPEMHLQVLKGSDHVALAIREPDRAVIGFATALSDGVLAAYVPLLEVLPDYRGRGIGTELMRLLLAEIGDLYMIDAMVDPGLQPFYRHLGMEPSTGAAIRTHSRQSGGRVSGPN